MFLKYSQDRAQRMPMRRLAALHRAALIKIFGGDHHNHYSRPVRHRISEKRSHMRGRFRADIQDDPKSEYARRYQAQRMPLYKTPLSEELWFSHTAPGCVLRAKPKSAARPALDAQRLGNHFRDSAREPVHVFLGFRFNHHPGESFRSRIADDQPPVAIEFAFGIGDGARHFGNLREWPLLTYSDIADHLRKHVQVSNHLLQRFSA